MAETEGTSGRCPTDCFSARKDEHTRGREETDVDAHTTACVGNRGTGCKSLPYEAPLAEKILNERLSLVVRPR